MSVKIYLKKCRVSQVVIEKDFHDLWGRGKGGELGDCCPSSHHPVDIVPTDRFEIKYRFYRMACVFLIGRVARDKRFFGGMTGSVIFWRMVMG